MGFGQNINIYCFSPFDAWTYYDCCREGSDSNTLRHLCFDDDYTFDRCCNFEFGPEIRGLPYSGAQPPLGVARLNFGRAGLLHLDLIQTCTSCERDLTGDGAERVWMNSWYHGLLLAELANFVLVAGNGDSWPDFRDVFWPLASPARALNVLDIGCGVGAASIAAARAGHNVTAADIDPAALELTRRNARRNGVALATTRWDMTKEPLPLLFRRRPFDVALVEVGTLLVRGIRDLEAAAKGDERSPAYLAALEDMDAAVGGVIRNLIRLDVGIAVFIGSWRALHDYPDNPTASLIKALTNYAQMSGATRRCWEGARPTRCKRKVMTSPALWLEQAGFAPPMRHMLILW